MIKKILVDKTDEVADVVERVVKEPADEITLVVPRKSVLGESVGNFHLLKRESEAAGKAIIIESVDENVLSLAKASRLPATHPLFEESRRPSSFSDIVLRPREEEPAAPRKISKAPAKRPVRPVLESKEIEAETVPVREEKPARLAEPVEARVGAPRPRRLKTILIVFAVVVVSAVVFWTVTYAFGHATVTIDFKKTPWTYSNSFTVSSAVSKTDAANRILPGELFTNEKNTTQFFPATGQSNLSAKATGKLTIYNAYSSASQTFVAATRFETPDGKIFRLVSQVVVPGAKVQSGSIVPSSIDAQVVADKAGADYNVGTMVKLTIPGLEGTSKYNGFYGALASGTSGGFVGIKPVPTASDTQTAQSKTSDIIKSALQSTFLTNYATDYKILDGASVVGVTRLNVNSATDQNGNFSVFGDGTMKTLAFKEDDLKAALLALVQHDNPGTVFDQVSITYSQIKPDFVHGTETFTVSVQATLKPSFSADDFKARISGKSVADARAFVADLAGLADAKISLWPVWLGSLPDNTNKISVIAN